jgi:hypothetical protein
MAGRLEGKITHKFSPSKNVKVIVEPSVKGGYKGDLRGVEQVAQENAKAKKPPTKSEAKGKARAQKVIKEYNERISGLGGKGGPLGGGRIGGDFQDQVK